MSNYRSAAINPVTGEYEQADFLDNYYGHHQYGVRFMDGIIYPLYQIDVPATTRDVIGFPDLEQVDEDEEAENLFRNIYINQDFKLQVVDTMKKYGGSFVQALAHCTLRADKENLRKLVVTFFDYYKKYSEWGQE